MKLSIIMPVYNEIGTIRKILSRVEKAPLPKGMKREIIIIDDGSTDGTRNIIKNLKHKVILHKKNLGKGGAVKTGFTHATGDIIIIQDADLEYDPRDYGKVIAPILRKEAEVVYGSRRLLKENQQYSGVSFYLGGVLVTWMTNLLYFTYLTDEPTCYKAFSRKALRSVKIKADNFDWEPEITAKLLKAGYRIAEVPIRYYPRHIDEGKKIRWKDGVSAIWTLFKYRFVE